MNWTKSANIKLTEYLDTHNLSKGIGTKESACSIAAINLALNGTLKDDVPECMSEAIGEWIIRIQDQFPNNLRNSMEWKSLLPLAAGTGREKETERLNLIRKWIWETVLPPLNPAVSNLKLFPKWESMLDKKNSKWIEVVYSAAHNKSRDDHAPESIRGIAFDVKNIATYLTLALDDKCPVDEASGFFGSVFYYATDIANSYSNYDYWNEVDCCGLLEKMIKI